MERNVLFHILGCYESESDDIDVPLSKRINRLNIENTGITHGRNLSATPFSAYNSSSDVTNMQARPIDNAPIIDYDNRPYSNHISYQNLTHNQRIQNMWPTNHDSCAAGDSNVPRTNLCQEPIESSSQGTRSSINSDPVHSTSSFRERYNYPENSQYYQSNQLLYVLFQERQTRQNTDTS